MGINHSQRKSFLPRSTQSAQRKPFTPSRSLRSLR